LVASATSLLASWGPVIVVAVVIASRVVLDYLKRARQIAQWTAEENAERRWLFLEHLCELAKGSTRNGVSPKRMREALGWHRQEVRAVRDDLESARLLERRESKWATVAIKVIDSLQGQQTEGQQTSPESGVFVFERLHITALGIDRVQANRAPGVPSLNVSGQGHQVMVNSPGAYQSAQHTFIASDVAQVVQEYRRALSTGGLDADTATQARRYLVVVDGELRKPMPDVKVLRPVLGILYQIALGAAGNAAWAAVVALLQPLIGR
jgi:hypothetical protein